MQPGETGGSVPGPLGQPLEPDWELAAKQDVFSPGNFSAGKENLSNSSSFYVLISCWNVQNQTKQWISDFVAFQSDTVKQTRRCLFKQKHLALPQFTLKAFSCIFPPLFKPFSVFSHWRMRDNVFQLFEEVKVIPLLIRWENFSAGKSWEPVTKLWEHSSLEVKKLMQGSHWHNTDERRFLVNIWFLWYMQNFSDQLSRKQGFFSDVKN